MWFIEVEWALKKNTYVLVFPVHIRRKPLSYQNRNVFSFFKTNWRKLGEVLTYEKKRGGRRPFKSVNGDVAT